jgi:hypothetical protein
MSTHEPTPGRSADLLKEQRSHVLFVLSNPKARSEDDFRAWYLSSYQRAVLELQGVLGGQQYEPHEVDISAGKYPGLPFGYLGMYDVSIDGAQAVLSVMDYIKDLHHRETSAQAPATWLYYPASERVGQAPSVRPSLLTMAFANAVCGQEAEFREWYATRHIRHALSIPALVSGQCFALTEFQSPGAMDAIFSMIAVYEQEGSPQEMRQNMQSLPPGALDFPAMDLTRFAEWVYRPCPRQGTRTTNEGHAP